MKIYTVYVTRDQISRENRATAVGSRKGDGETLAYARNVRTEGRRAAAEKCIDSIWTLCDPDIRVISVHVGIKGNVSAAANRLAPIQFKR